MKFFILGLFYFFSFSGFAQNELTIFFGAGFDSTKCTLTISYWKNESYNVDTLLMNKLLVQNYSTGLSHSVTANLPKKELKEIRLIVDGTKYNFRFDKLRKGSQLRIEFLDGIDFCLFQKRKFHFY